MVGCSWPIRRRGAGSGSMSGFDTFSDLYICGPVGLGCGFSARNAMALPQRTNLRLQGIVAAKAGVDPKAVVSLARRGRVAGLTPPGSVRTPVWYAITAAMSACVSLPSKK